MVMVATDRKEHWEWVYSTKGETGVSWYQREPRLSLELIRAVAPAAGGRIIDIGGGASGLVDRLLDLPFEKIAVLDISETALGKARARLARVPGVSNGLRPISLRLRMSAPSRSGTTGPCSTS